MKNDFYHYKQGIAYTFLFIEGPLNQIKKFFSFIRLWGNVVYKVEKS